MKRHARRWLLASAACYLIALVVLTPASMVAVVLHQFSKGRLELVNTQGTIWNGTGDLVASDKGRVIGKYDWRFLVRPLLAGRIEMRLGSNGADETTVALNYQGLTIDRFRADLPFDALSGIVPEIAKYGLNGTLVVAVDNLRLSFRNVFGSVTGQLNNASSPVSKINPFGSYQVRLEGQGDNTTILVQAISGSALIVEGNGSLSRANGISFQGRASPSLEHKELLAPLLNMIGGGAGDSIPIVLR